MAVATPPPVRARARFLTPVFNTLSLSQLAWAAIFLLAVTPLYYDKYACMTYCGLLLIQIVSNGGSFYAYKLRKLKSAEDKLKVYEGDDEDTEIINFFDDGPMPPAPPSRPRPPGGREISTVIRTATQFKVSTTGYGRSHRAKMSRVHNHGKTVEVVRRGEVEGEELVGKLAKERRMESKSSSRPEL